MSLAGMFVPVFVIGAGLGRLTGEVMNIMFPHGLLGEYVCSPPLLLFISHVLLRVALRTAHCRPLHSQMAATGVIPTT